MMWMQMLDRLLTAEQKAGLEGGEAGLQGLPGIFDRQQQHAIAEVFHDHLRAAEAVQPRAP
jgi:hypothetical protein